MTFRWRGKTGRLVLVAVAVVFGCVSGGVLGAGIGFLAFVTSLPDTDLLVAIGPVYGGAALGMLAGGVIGFLLGRGALGDGEPVDDEA